MSESRFITHSLTLTIRLNILDVIITYNEDEQKGFAIYPSILWSKTRIGNCVF